MKKFYDKTLRAAILAVLTSASLSATGQLGQDSSDYAALPPLAGTSIPPFVMLAMSNDHQLFYKAFTDYDDLDGDGRAEITYTHTIDYEGYFDPALCYKYDQTGSSVTFQPTTTVTEATAGNGQANTFRPSSVANNGYCNGYTGGAFPESGDEWSGNFLNWASMTRVDEVRLVLYGGYRSTDTADLTILERSYLPNDAHSFAKYYNGDDLGALSPFGNLDTKSDISDVPRDASDVSPGIVYKKKTVDPDKVKNSGDEYEVDTHNEDTVPEDIRKARTNGITFCNTTIPGDGDILVADSDVRFSQYVNQPPLLRAVAGNYMLWAASERWQCLLDSDVKRKVSEKQRVNGDGGLNKNRPADSGLYSYNREPKDSDSFAEQANGDTIGDYHVRVEVCSSYQVLGSPKSDRCRQYPSGNFKPSGLLTDYGANDEVRFGLMTGSYLKNKSGGVLRKNVGFISNEINFTTDGTLSGNAGVISNIDALRIVNYDGKKGHYNDSDNCGWGKNEFADGSCTNWGNPIAEILHECYRYFQNAGPTTLFDADDSTLLPNLTTDSWQNPMDTQSQCAKLSVIAFNASSVSYDGDNIASLGSIGVDQFVDRVGSLEGLNGVSSFIGLDKSTANGKDGLCSPKPMTLLSKVRGTCPDAPRLEGTYMSAGLAYWAHTTDLRPDLTQTTQTVDTYAVALSPAVPSLTIPTAYGEVTILPACRNQGIDGNCGLVDFKILYQDASEGKIYINWEDTEQGGDYDQDMAGILEYEISSNQIEVSTTAIGQSTGGKMGFGFSISGVKTPGFYALSGINGFNESDDCSDCKVDDDYVSKSFEIGGSSATLLEQPLSYAAKYGGFKLNEDQFSNIGSFSGIADYPQILDQSSWDAKNNRTGEIGSDGLPDNYFFAVNPALLRTQLQQVLRDILQRTSSGSAAAVVASTGSGEGVLYQALYSPFLSNDAQTESVTWTGSLTAILKDANGNFRADDGSVPNVIDADDRIVRFVFNEQDNETEVFLYKALPGGQIDETVSPDKVPINKFEAFWSAGKQLTQYGLSTTDNQKQSQRANYISSEFNGRRIYTAIDSDTTDSSIRASGNTSPSLVPFVAETFDANETVLDLPDNETFRLLGLTDATKDQAADIVNFIRGQEIPGYRSRTLDGIPYLLPDIVHSSPVSVGKPVEDYDFTYGDDGYKQFKARYKNRREVVYVGSNGGMLHAFNGGTFDPATRARDGAGAPLGSELWAYVPYNLLPHLRWLTEPDYPHVYYMDGDVQSFDVKIFKDDLIDATPLSESTYPGGWGTIIVASMRLGGNPITIDPNSDPDADASDDITMGSAYVIMDVTDPESEPKLIAEIIVDGLGFTTVAPVVVKDVELSINQNNVNKWQMLFGSGPTAASNGSSRNGVSNQAALMYSYNFGNGNIRVREVGEANSFIGGIVAADWDNDFRDDVIYFGTVAGTDPQSGAQGSLRRAKINIRNFNGNLADSQTSNNKTVLTTVTHLLNEFNRPFMAPPSIKETRNGDQWVFGGTGRFLHIDDNQSTQAQRYYAVKEPRNAADTSFSYSDTVIVEDLVDTSGISVGADTGAIFKVGSNGTVTEGANISVGYGANATSNAVSVFDDVKELVATSAGWFFDLGAADFRQFEEDFDASTAGLADTSDYSNTHNTTKATFSGASLVFTAYSPSRVGCIAEGYGFVFAPRLDVGLTDPNIKPVGRDEVITVVNGQDERIVFGAVNIGRGQPSPPKNPGPNNDQLIIQSSTGAIPKIELDSAGIEATRQTWREIKNLNF